MKRILSVILSFTLLLGLCVPGVLAADTTAQTALSDTAAYLTKTLSSPTSAAVGGDWAILALSRGGCTVPDGYYDTYYKNLVSYVQSCKGVLSARRYTEYERVALSLTALGKDPTSVGGYDILKPLGDFDKTVLTGLSGAAFALIALDAWDYEVPVNAEAATQATRELYLAYLLNRQLEDGGWALTGTAADPDVTAMVLQALAGYQDNSAVKSATAVAVSCLSKLQNSNGGFTYGEVVTSASTSQVILALCALGISVTDSRFVKNGKSPLDHLLTYFVEGGGFKRTDTLDMQATEQALCALVALQRAGEGKPFLFDMSDVDTAATEIAEPVNPGVTPSTVTAPGVSFTDIQDHANQTAIEALASYGIINGMGQGTFLPNETMTRAQFAKIVVCGLGLTPEYRDTFSDVTSTAWYAGYVDTAAAYGIVNGVGSGKYNPDGTITRQEAAAMVARAAKLCGLDTAIEAAAAETQLAGFTDHAQVSGYASKSLAYCYQAGILDSADTAIQPTKAILRCEIAQMLYNMLQLTSLLQ